MWYVSLTEAIESIEAKVYLMIFDVLVIAFALPWWEALTYPSFESTKDLCVCLDFTRLRFIWNEGTEWGLKYVCE